MFDNWADRYTNRFWFLMVAVVVVMVLTTWVHAVKLRSRQTLEETGSYGGAHLARLAPGLVYPFLLFASVVLMSLFLMVQVLVLALLSIVAYYRRWTPRRYGVIGLMVTVSLVLAAGGRGVREAERARNELPFISLADRVAAAVDVPTDPPILTDAGKDALERAEKKLQQSDRPWFGGSRRRRASLALVHATQVLQFVTSEGFGFGRMLGPDIPGAKLAALKPYAQPVARGMGVVESTGMGSDLWIPLKGPVQRLRGMNLMHEEVSHDFAEPVSYGLVRDLEHVTGFRAHGLKQPDRYVKTIQRVAAVGATESVAGSWKLERIELVSLIKHAEPGVYLSNNVPRMDELNHAELRPLDRFETVALQELRDGEPLVIRARGNEIKMLGAVRAAEQCSSCHEVPRGFLLGAFSYCFRDQADASSSE